jgi:hypothetical protein
MRPKSKTQSENKLKILSAEVSGKVIEAKEGAMRPLKAL